MSYYFTTILRDISFEDAIDRTKAALKDKGFGVLTEIDLKTTLKEKIDVDFYKYAILGACNPKLAYGVLQAEDKIGLMLPCNVIVQEKEEGVVEVSAIDPIASMAAVENHTLEETASKVKGLLSEVISGLK